MDWREQQYENYQEELSKENECSFCGEPCEDTHCSVDCKKNDYTERI